MAQSVVIYWPDADDNTPAASERAAIAGYFGLQHISVSDARIGGIPEQGSLIITPRHAHKQAQAAGAQYMGREFALKKAGML